MRVGASPSQLESDGKRQAKLSDEKAKLPDEKAKSPHEKATKKDAPAPIKSWASRLPPPEGTYRAQEVLGFNLTPAAHERLRQLGYTPKPSTASGLTQIILPEGLDPWTAQRQLEAEFQQGFALNFLYDHYRNELDSAPITGLVPVSGSEGCTTERCYGRKVIGWKDQIGACAKGVKIGVIDTGYDAGHTAFANLKATVVMEDEASRSPDWHGTGVLSLLGGAAKSSTPGLVPEAEFLIADAFFKNHVRARPDRYARVLLEALRRLEKHGAQVINMSLVGPSDELVHARIADMSAAQGRGVHRGRGQRRPGRAAGLSRRLQGSHRGHRHRRQEAQLRLRQSRPLHRRGGSGGAHLDGAACQQGGHAERDVLCGTVRDGDRRRRPTTARRCGRSCARGACRSIPRVQCWRPSLSRSSAPAAATTSTAWGW